MQDGARSSALALRVDLESVVAGRGGGGGGGGSSFIGAGGAGVFGAGYFVEVGSRWSETADRAPFVIAGMTLRLPFAFAAALFR